MSGILLFFVLFVHHELFALPVTPSLQEIDSPLINHKLNMEYVNTGMKIGIFPITERPLDAANIRKQRSIGHFITKMNMRRHRHHHSKKSHFCNNCKHSSQDNNSKKRKQIHVHTIDHLTRKHHPNKIDPRSA